MTRLARFLKRYGAAAAGGAYALTFGLADKRHRALIQQIARHFGVDDRPARLIPAVDPGTLTSDFTSISLPEPEAQDGNVSLLELLVLARLIRERRPSRIFEIGTFDGRTTLALAENAPSDGVVFTLDLPAGAPTELSLAANERQYVDKPASGARLSGKAAAQKVTQLFGDSATFDFSGYPAEFVFVDASHAYEYVLKDSESAVGMVSATGLGGTVVWHDYGEWDGVTRALNELHARDARFSGLRWVRGTTLAVLDVRASAPIRPESRA